MTIASDKEPTQNKPIKIWKIFIFPALMFGFAFSLVPIYNTLCDLTGFNGRSNSLKQANYDKEISPIVDENRSVNVTFVTNVANGLPITFKAKENILEITPGKLYNMNFVVSNRSNDVIVGQAVPSVSPPQAAIHFIKMECFCFQEQVFAPGVNVEMPVRFTMDPAMDQDVKDVSLSYTFYLIERRKATEDDATKIKIHNKDFTKIITKEIKDNRS